MIIPEGLVVGVACPVGTQPPPGIDLVEVRDDRGNLPRAADVRALAGGRAVTLIAWHVLTHRRSDPRYQRMTAPPPEHAAIGHLERSRWTDEAWEATDALARATDAQAAVLQTPKTFRPTGEYATRLENFVAHAMRPGLQIAWEWAPGSWPHDKATALCERIGAIPVIDPSEHPIPDGEYCYARYRGGRGGRQPLDDDDLKRGALALRDRVGWVVFANADAAEDAARFAAML